MKLLRELIKLHIKRNKLILKLINKGPAIGEVLHIQKLSNILKGKK